MTRRIGGETSGSADAGFTLVELMVALVVVAVLIGIALPTFLGTRRAADDSAAKSATMQGLKTQQAIYIDGDGYGGIDAVREAEPGLDFAEFSDPDDIDPQVLGRVYVRTADDEVTVVSPSGTGTCFWARGRAGVVEYAKGACSSPPDFATSW